MGWYNNFAKKNCTVFDLRILKHCTIHFNKEIIMEKLELHYVSNSGIMSDSNISKSIHVKEIVIFYLYFEWV